MSTDGTHPVRVLWLMGSDRPKADTISLIRWLRALDREAISLAAGFLSAATGVPGPAGEFVAEDGSPQTLPDALTACGAEVVRWRGASVLRPGSVRPIVEFVRDRGIDILVSAYLGADLLAGQVRECAEVRWIARAAGIGIYRRTRLYAGDWFDRLVYRRADGFLANAAPVRDDWAKRLRRAPSDFRVIHNAVPALPGNLAGRQQTRDRLGVGPDESLLLTVGRLDREKGIELLIDAAAILGKGDAGGKPRFVVLGGGPWRARLDRRIARLGIGGQVRLAGETSEVWPHLAAADAFVLPSRMEGCANALLEAASAGLPIVAFNVGAIPELVRDSQEALLAPPESGPAGLAKRILRLLSDKELARGLGQAAQARMRSRFAPCATAAEHKAYFVGLACC